MQASAISIESSPLSSLDGDILILPTVADRLDDSTFNRSIYRELSESSIGDFREDLPLKIGNVSVTAGEDLPVDRVVHVPVQTAPGVPTTRENLQIGLRSGLVTADEEGVTSVIVAPIIPDNQRENLNLDEVAGMLRQDLVQYPPAHFKALILYSTDQNWLQALRSAFE
jgi:hypothetical protein